MPTPAPQCWNEALVNTALSDAPIPARPGKLTPGHETTAGRCFFLKRSGRYNMAVRLETTASAQESTSLKFGWVKKCSVQRRPSGRNRAGESRTVGSTYRVPFGGGSWREAASSICALDSRVSPRPRRVIVVAHSRRVLATGPCWHSFSQRHVTASPHNSEARVLFRGSDWLGAAEARPERRAPIGCRSINSDCHVLVKGSAHNVAL